MRFQLGYSGFRKFKKMIKAVKENKWLKAQNEIRDSKYYNQVTKRAERVIKLLKG